MFRLILLFVGVFLSLPSWAVDLRGVANVNVTSDTAATAKNMAFDEARRQIIMDSLRQYADVNALRDAIKQAKTSELTDLIAESSIDGEKLSDTTYSARISMTVDLDASRRWLEQNEVQNWLPDDTKRDGFTVVINLSEPLADWGRLNQIARNEKIDFDTKNITGNVVTLELPNSVRGRFTIAVREAGWRYANKDGVLNLWK